jgi:hypothetical protein
MYVDFDYGKENDAFGLKKNASWVVIGVAARYQARAHTAVSVRYENYEDQNGFITGQTQALNSFTLTGEYKWVDGLLSRIGYRLDWSDQNFFERGTGLSRNPDTLTPGLVAYFEPK